MAEQATDKDYVIRVLSADGGVLGLACVTTGLVEVARSLHETAETATAALGRALTGGALMAALLKRDQRLAIKIEADGPLKKIIVEADSDGAVRGFVGDPTVNLPPRGEKIDVSGAVGKNGYLTVIKDLGAKEPYSGVVKLRTGEIAEDLAYYFAVSEQIPTALALGVFVTTSGAVGAAGGFLVQTMPPVDEGRVDELIKGITRMDPVTKMLREGLKPEDMIAAIFNGIPYRTLESKALRFRCHCHRERIERVIISLGAAEISSLLADVGETTVTCEFCRRAYHFSRADLEGILAEITNQGT
ncbi:MAG: Hsp33 family molecular chaperone HslO [Syntrophales bacterium]|nr:Hsp33 family molecular chaperone HslO [Syntrophales bacterium]